MNALDIFKYEGQQMRHVLVDGEPWFVASDVARILDLGNVHSSVALLDDDEKGLHTVDTPGGAQSLLAVNEPGLYSLILRSRKTEAKLFKRWITHDVLPMIRKTGAFAVPKSREQLLARAVIEANSAISEAHQQIEALTPRAEAWDELASADGDYSVADAAKILARAGVQTGPQRLFEQLAGIRWIHRASDGKWRAYAAAVDNGYLTEKPQSHHHPRSGELVLDAPQVRVTVRGLERLRVRLGSIETGHAA